MNILLKTNGGRGGRGRKPDFVGGGGRDRKPNFVACSARLVGGWVVDKVRARFFVFSRHGCLSDMMDGKVVIEVVVGVVVLE